MLLHEFPNINWLKKQIAENFRQQRSWDNKDLHSSGWPTVVLNAQVKQLDRPEIEGPFSMFINLKGESRLKVASKEIKISDSVYGISNRGQTYSLFADAGEHTETFNIHFGDQFCKQAFLYLTKSDRGLLDGLEKDTEVMDFSFRSYFKGWSVDKKINALKRAYSNNNGSIELEEKQFDLFEEIWYQNHANLKAAKNIDAVKFSTRMELLARLNLALDLIHSSISQKLDLDTISASACLSKFHFVRLFKEVYKISPYQYIKSIRLEKAKQYIKQGEYPVNQIALMVGYENGSSLSRAYFKYFGSYPSLE